MFNTLKVGILLIVLTAILVLIGNMVGGTSGMVFAFGFAVLMNFGSYWFSDKIVLKMTGAQPLSASEAPDFHAMVKRLVERADLPMPKLYIVPDPSPNAFATGRNPEHGVVAVNQGLLDLLNEEEVEGVVAHELAHIKYRDTLTSAVVATVAGAIMMIANMIRWGAILGSRDDREGGSALPALAMSIIAPIAAMVIQLAVSRAREYEADKAAAFLTRKPRALASALSRLSKGVELIPGQMSPSTAHMCIVNPLKGTGAFLMNLFSTHPPLEKRIEKLMAMDV